MATYSALSGIPSWAYRETQMDRDKADIQAQESRLRAGITGINPITGQPWESGSPLPNRAGYTDLSLNSIPAKIMMLQSLAEKQAKGDQAGFDELASEYKRQSGELPQFKDNLLKPLQDYQNQMTGLLDQTRNTSLAAVQEGGDPTALKEGYGLARGGLEKALNNVTEKYDMLMEDLGRLESSGLGDKLKNLDLIKQTLNDTMLEHTRNIMDLEGRGVVSRGLVNKSFEIAFNRMRDMVPQQIQRAEEMQKWMFGEREGLGTWQAGSESSLRGQIAGAHMEEANRLTDLQKWKSGQEIGIAERYADDMGEMYGDVAEGKMGAETTVRKMRMDLGEKRAKASAESMASRTPDYSALESFVGGTSPNRTGVKTGAYGLPSRSIGLSMKKKIATAANNANNWDMSRVNAMRTGGINMAQASLARRASF